MCAWREMSVQSRLILLKGYTFFICFLRAQKGAVLNHLYSWAPFTSLCVCTQADFGSRENNLSHQCSAQPTTFGVIFQINGLRRVKFAANSTWVYKGAKFVWARARRFAINFLTRVNFPLSLAVEIICAGGGRQVPSGNKAAPKGVSACHFLFGTGFISLLLLLGCSRNWISAGEK